MSQLLTIRDRIRTIGNLHKVTTAMELVTQTRINRIRQNAVNAKQYQKTMRDLFTIVAQTYHPPLLPQKHREDNVSHCIIGFLAQKGLCGNFSDKVIGKFAIRLVPLRLHKNIRIFLTGRHSSKWDMVLKRPFEYIEANEWNYREQFAPQLKDWVQAIMSGIRMEIYFVHNEFISVLQQNPVVKQIYPLEPEKGKARSREVILEPEAPVLFEKLLRAYLEASIDQVYWESLAGEYCTRLITMKNANDNAELILDDLHLFYNKTRQYKITQELSEIVSAFDVLKLSQEKKRS
jgi:F-type H+-transporting ATPase subunit gamma